MQAAVIGRRREHQMAQAEALRHQLGYIGLGNIIHRDIAHAALREQARQYVRSVLRIAVHGRIGDQNALGLRLVGAPLLVLVQQQPQIRLPDRAVQRADGLDIQRRRLFEQCLHLRAILADNIGVIPARIVHPHAVDVDLVVHDIARQRTERTECVRGKQSLVQLVIGDHDLGPVHHRRHDEVQRMAAGGELVPLGNDQRALLRVHSVELLQHAQRLGAAHELGLRIAAQHLLDHCAVVRLHMLDDQIVQRAPAQRIGDILAEQAADRVIHRVQQHGLFVQQHIAVIRYPARDGEQIFKPAQAAITAANIDKILFDLSGTVHRTTPPCNIICENCNIFLQMRLPCRVARVYKKTGCKNSRFLTIF